MSLLMSIGLAVQVIAAIAIVILVLLQHGKGADLGAAFGAGASGSVFGAAGSGTVFFLSTIAITLASGAFAHRNAAQVKEAGGVLGTVSSVPADASLPVPAGSENPQGPSKNEIPK